MRLIFMAALFSLSATLAHADRLSGQEAASVMSQGTLQFVAGSVLTIRGDGTFSFRHGNGSSQQGTYTLYSNGQVDLNDAKSGQTFSFYFDEAANATSVVYVAGPWKGERYALR